MEKIGDITNETADNNRHFADIMRKHGAVINRVCLMYVDAGNSFEDLRQEALINIWRGIPGFRGQSSETTWIYRCTVNSCLTCIRAGKKHSGHVSLDDAINIVAGDDPVNQENLRQMYWVISKLNTFDKSLILMWLDGQPYSHIAAVAGISEQNVATRLHRIKAKIKELCLKY